MQFAAVCLDCTPRAGDVRADDCGGVDCSSHIVPVKQLLNLANKRISDELTIDEWCWLVTVNDLLVLVHGRHGGRIIKKRQMALEYCLTLVAGNA